MVLAKGSIVTIEGVAEGALSEDVTLSLNTTFKPMFTPVENDNVAKSLEHITRIGTVFRAATGIGFSSQFKQSTAQMWDKTDPASFRISIDFQRVPLRPSDGKQLISAAKMIATVKELCSIPLPGDPTGAGMLVPPGPSLIEGIGIDEFFSFISGKDDPRSYKQKGVVNVTIGSMHFRRLLMKSAEPTFSKYVDDSNYPISCRVSVEFISLWAASKEMVKEW